MLHKYSKKGGVGTFTVLQLAEGKRGVGRCRGHPELVRVAVPHGTFFYVLRGTRRSDPAALVRRAAQCAPTVLTDLPIPPDAAVRRFEPRRFPLRRALAALCTILPQTGVPPQKLSIGALDPNGALCGMTEALLPLAADVRVVTRDPERFEADALHAKRRFGASLTVGENASLLTRCDAVVCDVPDETLAGVSVVISAQPGHDAFSLLPVQLPDEYARLCPPGVDHELFAAALAEKCGVRVPALFFCDGVICGGERLDAAQAAALWRRRIEGQNFS